MIGRGAYYNEVDPFCVEWLKRLILADLIAPLAQTFIEVVLDILDE